jgi:hypothetical protein
MRTEPLVGKKVWFGPRRFGWGLDPVSIEGWLVVATMVLLSVRGPKEGRARVVTRFVTAALAVTAFLKGTSPGGPKARRAFHEAQETQESGPD